MTKQIHIIRTQNNVFFFIEFHDTRNWSLHNPSACISYLNGIEKSEETVDSADIE